MAKKKIEKSSLTRTQQFFPIIALIGASLCLVFSAEAARIACLDGLSAVPGGLSSIVTGAWLTDCLVLTLVYYGGTPEQFEALGLDATNYILRDVEKIYAQ